VTEREKKEGAGRSAKERRSAAKEEEGSGRRAGAEISPETGAPDAAASGPISPRGEGEPGGGETAPALEEALRAEVRELTDKWLRAAADLENFRKRAARDRERDLWEARAGVTLALLEVLDDLERALSDEKAAPETFRRGIEMIRDKFLASLDSIGVSPFNSFGELFDPEKHEALQSFPTSSVREGHVAAEIRRGFRTGDRVLRHALVAVAVPEEKADNQERNVDT
jgi:molecular chaperone GrpE